MSRSYLLHDSTAAGRRAMHATAVGQAGGKTGGKTGQGQVHSRAAGFTLVELMIALVLGLLVIAGVGSVFLANKNAYRSNEALSQVQDAARTSFEYLARDIRAAGANFCGVSRVESVLNPGNDLLGLASVIDAVEGWNDSGSVPSSFGLPAAGDAGAPVAETPLIRLTGSQDAGLALADSTVARSQIELASGAAANTGNVLMLCDTDRAVIFQVTGMSGQVVEHGAGATGIDEAPGNSTGTFPDDPTFAASSYLAAPTNYLWYIGENPEGSQSLYRHGLGAQGIQTTEMARGLKADDAGDDWDIRYHVRGEDGFVDAAGVGSNWGLVDAVRLTITTQSRGIGPDGSTRGVGTDGNHLERTFTTTIAIRSRVERS